ncbi:C4-dicarboxylate transporter DcuC [Tuwongella immobilis]|uniref:TRAP C4-dicarboxylate transport system permease DctM subunit domain-containing protein n=1 Tax=Tuwongella immobilis TaxID=692036 RepID=A0A6C2YKS3_9BACT|nr:C4-dicarboxylate transporter DcuC [Tuwongella immobilis]VIP01977.1 c4-dicarboxylate abc transporter : C4-dicarboxylate transporter OS=Nodularia spumigena CCY9414 GN=N9414_15717 PE=4 SV=1: DcuC [Tuwongella immobilis]VTS00018.1 c4-dicarboxylate abc transporter : C4-dicarboxylate transporter OS=Nodularia spumigena CCY9414 GN=N9414_15717 PE=4 SV=1: DcuC [Tuwongella immobilis]
MLVVTFGLIGLAVIAILRGVDVRLALFAAALLLATILGQPLLVVQSFLSTFADGQFVVPICTSMGFAYVLKLTGCDQHLVQTLLRPLRHVRFFLIPGILLVGFIVNTPVISQTSTAVCLGPVVVPLMRANGFSPLTIGATLLLGTSIGGELLNPGAPELRTVSVAVGIPSRELVSMMLPLVIPHLLIAFPLFWWMTNRAERKLGLLPRTAPSSTDGVSAEFRINPIRAMIPLVPLGLLFISGPPLNLLPAETLEWIRARIVSPTESPMVFESRMIGLAMLIGTVAAAFSNLAVAKDTMKSFFEGAGYAFTHVISLIVIASTLAKAVQAAGIAEQMHQLVLQFPNVLTPLAAMLTLAFACLTGSGMAATRGLYGFFVEPAQAVGVDPAELGVLVSLAAAAGRTMSPVAAVTIICATMTGTNPFTLMLRVAIPLLVSFTIVVTLRMAGMI